MIDFITESTIWLCPLIKNNRLFMITITNNKKVYACCEMDVETGASNLLFCATNKNTAIEKAEEYLKNESGLGEKSTNLLKEIFNEVKFE